MTIFQRVTKSIINWAYGYDLSKLNPDYRPPLYYFSKCDEYKPIYIDDSCGFDLIAWIDPLDQIKLYPGDKYKIPTGLFIELPKHYEARVQSRSGLSSDFQLLLLNGIGEIDTDYRGEIQMSVKNLSKEDIIITNKERIGQIVINQITKINPYRVPMLNMLSPTKRGDKGFGHSGTDIIKNNK